MSREVVTPNYASSPPVTTTRRAPCAEVYALSYDNAPAALAAAAWLGRLEAYPFATVAGAANIFLHHDALGAFACRWCGQWHLWAEWYRRDHAPLWERTSAVETPDKR